VEDKPLLFPPGSQYHYSNSDSAVPSPKVHGYGGDDDVTELFAARWAWASGGVVSTPRDADRFVRAYASAFSAGPYRAGTRSATVTVNDRIVPDSNARVFTELRFIYEYAVCAALAR
jgi:hypothetical protein